jgi:hypothetical protein
VFASRARHTDIAKATMIDQIPPEASFQATHCVAAHIVTSTIKQTRVI